MGGATKKHLTGYPLVLSMKDSIPFIPQAPAVMAHSVMTVVVPPLREKGANSWNGNMLSIWVWASIKPGQRYDPSASISVLLKNEALPLSCSTETIRPFFITTAMLSSMFSVKTLMSFPFRITVSAGADPCATSRSCLIVSLSILISSVFCFFILHIASPFVKSLRNEYLSILCPLPMANLLDSSGPISRCLFPQGFSCCPRA